MAEITMDVSEYNVILENKKLLEEALEREKYLNNEIQKLKEERIEALEQSSQKVSVVSTKRIIETVSVIEDPKEVFANILTQIGFSYRDVEYVKHSNINFEKLLYRIFKKRDIEEDLGKTVSYKGFDEVEKVLEDKIRAEFLDKIEEAEKVLGREMLWRKDSESMKLKVSSLLDEIQNLQKEKTSLSEKLETALNNVEIEEKYNKLFKKMERLKEVVKDGCGIFTIGTYTKRINDIIYDYNREK